MNETLIFSEDEVLPWRESYFLMGGGVSFLSSGEDVVSVF